MRVLVCASEAPLPPLNGVRLALRELCAQLAGSHEVCVLAYRWPDQHGDPPAGVEHRPLDAPPLRPAARLADRARSLWRLQPTEAPRLGRPMARAVEKLRRERSFDVAHVTLGVLAGVSGALDGLPTVLVPLDSWSRNAATEANLARGGRWAWLRLQHALVRRYETHAYRRFARVVCVTDVDAEETARRDGQIRTVVIPNGVDSRRFAPDPTTRRDTNLVVLAGDLAYGPNVEAARRLALQIFPLLRELRPEVRLVLAGRNPASSVRSLAQPGVRVVADPPDLQPWLAKAGVVACPMASGTGMKNKVLEAMACAAPIVATPLACQGLAVRDGQHLMVAKDDDAFAGAVARLLAEPALASGIGAAARRYVEQHHRWEDVARRYEALYGQVIAEASSG